MLEPSLVRENAASLSGGPGARLDGGWGDRRRQGLYGSWRRRRRFRALCLAIKRLRARKAPGSE
jgi:hypothetical protein